MQTEVDDLRRRARWYERDIRQKRAASKPTAAEDAQRNLLVQRANIEQQKVDAWRHNLKHCSNKITDSH